MQARLLGELEGKLQRKRDRIRKLERENNFYHQTTTIFLTIKKVMEKEKQFCFILADMPSLESTYNTPSDTSQGLRKRKEIMEGIELCRR